MHDDRGVPVAVLPPCSHSICAVAMPTTAMLEDVSDPMSRPVSSPWLRALLWAGLALLLCGCGKTIQHTGTEQLLASDAVDRAISHVDFSPLAGETVYFDTQYIRNVKSVGFVNAEYIISALRQQLLSAGCRLVPNEAAAKVIVEARVGALGADQHELTYGLPANNLLSSLSSLAPGTPTVPTVPEIAIAKKNNQSAAAKIGVFAYYRDSREPIWQSGVKQARSRSREVWVLGAGPYQSGSIYDGPRFAGNKVQGLFESPGSSRDPDLQNDYFREIVFADPTSPATPTDTPGPPAVSFASQTADIEAPTLGTAPTGGKKPRPAPMTVPAVSPPEKTDVRAPDPRAGAPRSPQDKDAEDDEDPTDEADKDDGGT